MCLFRRSLNTNVIRLLQYNSIIIYYKSQIIIDDTLILTGGWRMLVVGVIEQLEWNILPAIYQNIIHFSSKNWYFFCDGMHLETIICDKIVGSGLNK